VGIGGGGCFLYSLEDLLNKNVRYTSIFIKITLKFTFLCKTLKKKMFEIFCEAFLILNLLEASCTYFPFEKSGSFYHLAVRIMVNLWKY
jgi:hypothetical protein